MIPERTRVWAQRHLPSAIVSIRPVSGGRTDSVNAIDLADGSRRTLRFLDADAWGPTGARHAAAEAIGWRLAARAAIPAPTLIAVDDTAREAGGFASLSSWLPGRVRLEALSEADIQALAEVAVAIHAIGVDIADRPRAFEPWAPPRPEIPVWAKDRASWRAALKVYAEAAPPTVARLIHRDFHAGNILWESGRLSGVIDWAETSWGPAEIDVMHVRTNLAILQGPEAADAFRTAYARAGGSLHLDPATERYWAVADILGFLPDPAPILNRLIRGRTDLDADAVRSRLEGWLAHTLDG